MVEMIVRGYRKRYVYKLWVDDSSRPGMVCVGRDDKGFDSLRFYAGNRIEDWPEGIKFFVEHQYTEDILIGGIHWVLVSDRVCQVFELSMFSGIQFLPVWVEEKASGSKIGQYWAINVTKEVEALDWEHTRWVYPDRVETDEHPALNIAKEVLKSNLVEGADIFRLRTKGRGGVNVYLSKKVKRCLETANATKGLLFIPIEIWP